MTELAPTFNLSAAAKCYSNSSCAAEVQISSGTPFDFTAPVHYFTVSSDSLITNDYTVTVSVTPVSTAKQILTFGLPGLPAVIDQDAKTIAWNVPYGTDVTTLVPVYTVSQFATGSPTNGTIVDFTDPVTYTVTAQDSSTQDYVVTVTVLPDWPTLINVNYYGGSKPGNADMDGIFSYDAIARGSASRVAPSTYSGNVWNDFSNSGASGSNLKDSKNGTTSVGFVTSMEAGPWNDWNGFGARLNVSAVLASYNVYKPIFTLTGLDPDHAYDLHIASLLNSDNHPTDFKVWSAVQHLENNPVGSTDWIEGRNFVHFVSLIPDSSGTLVVYAKGTGDWNGIVVNGFQLQDMGVRGLNPDAFLYSFSFPGAVPVTWVGTDISINMVVGTDASALTPAFTMSPGATCTADGKPVVSGDPVDFSSPVHFIVKSEDESNTTDYTVTVNLVVANANLISVDFVVGGSGGDGSGATAPCADDTVLTGSTMNNADGLVFAGQVGFWNAMKIGTYNQNSAISDFLNNAGGVATTVKLALGAASGLSDPGDWRCSPNEGTPGTISQLRAESAYLYNGVITGDHYAWSFTGLNPNHQYKMVFFGDLGNAGGAGNMANGVAGIRDSEGDWNWDGITADGSGTISGIFTAPNPTLGIYGIQIEDETKPAGTVLILR